MQQEAAGFAIARVFHFDDLGAEPGERLGAGRTGLELAQVQNTDPGKIARGRGTGSHVFIPPARACAATVNPIVCRSYFCTQRSGASPSAQAVGHLAPHRAVHRLGFE